MSQQRFTGRDVQVTLSDGTRLLFDSITLNIDLGIGTSKTQGRPDGWTTGEAAADGEVTLSTVELDKLIEQARQAGSWRMVPAADMSFYANIAGRAKLMEAFGVKFNGPDFNLDSSNNERLQHKIPFMITSPDFVRIDGVPLLEEAV